MAAIRRRWNDESLQSMDESLELMRAGRSPHVRSHLEWEHLTPEEIEQVGELLDQIGEICQRSRSRGGILPDGSRPFHLAIQVCELGGSVMPSPLLMPEVSRRPGALGEIVDRIDHARDRLRTATA